jgi:hypothetical protein
MEDRSALDEPTKDPRMTLYRAALPTAERKKAEAMDAKRQESIIKASKAARAATAALHHAISQSDQHSKGLAAALAHLAETVTTVIEVRHLTTISVCTPQGKFRR